MTKTQTDKPLNQVQVKNLKEIAAGDFEDLRSRVFQELDDRKDQKLKEIDERYKDFDTDAEEEKLHQLGRKLEDEIRAALNDLKQRGYKIRPERYNREYTVSIDVDVHHEQRDTERSNVIQAHRNLLNRAKKIIDREHRATERIILLQSITSDAAMEILNDLPTAEDVLPLIASEMMSESDEDDVKTLIGDIKPKALQEENE